MSASQFAKRCTKIVAVGRNYAGERERTPAETAKAHERELAPALTVRRAPLCLADYPPTAAHAKELNNPLPKQPLLFLKPPSCFVVAGQKVKVPRQSRSATREEELPAGCSRQYAHSESVFPVCQLVARTSTTRLSWAW